MTEKRFGMLSKPQHSKRAYPEVEAYNKIQNKRIRLNLRIARKKTTIMAMVGLISSARIKLRTKHRELERLEQKDEPLLNKLNLAKHHVYSAEKRVKKEKLSIEREQIKKKLNL